MRSPNGLPLLILFLSLLLIGGALAFDCGCQHDPSCPPCSDGRCCSQFGWCGCMPVYCDVYCQSNCNGGVCGADEADSIILDTTITVAKAKDLGSVIMPAQFESMSKHGSGNKFHSGFYTYQALLTAARSFSGFADNSPIEIRKREVAAFLAQLSHETTSGGSPNAPDGTFKISWNFSYRQAGKAIGVDLINNLDLVAKDPVISLKIALWFWMTPQSPKPSPHDVIIRKWNPSPADRAANRLLGFGVITNIINGGLECGKGANQRAQERIGLYTRYCTILGIHPGDNLDCANQNPFGT